MPSAKATTKTTAKKRGAKLAFPGAKPFTPGKASATQANIQKLVDSAVKKALSGKKAAPKKTAAKKAPAKRKAAKK